MIFVIASPIEDSDQCFNYAGNMSNPLFDESCYTKLELGDKRFLYHRSVNNVRRLIEMYCNDSKQDEEVEIIMDYEIPEQWMAFGIRPSNITTACYWRAGAQGKGEMHQARILLLCYARLGRARA